MSLSNGVGHCPQIIFSVPWLPGAQLKGYDLSSSFSYKNPKNKHFEATPLKFNMEPEKKSLEKEIPFGNHHFQVPCQISGE